MTVKYRCPKCGLVTRLDDGEVPFVCACGAVVDAVPGLSPQPSVVKREHPKTEPTPVEGPGTELKRVLKSIGIKHTCSWCADMLARMNRLGPDGCASARDELVTELRSRGVQMGLATKVQAGVLAVLTGLAFSIDPTDPYPGLIDEAIRRSRCR